MAFSFREISNKKKMYIGILYDHTFIKNYDRDFVGDAILSFYPAEVKEKVWKISQGGTLLYIKI